jgi:eukaryotic-like serine/threonine-protein kinase
MPAPPLGANQETMELPSSRLVGGSTDRLRHAARELVAVVEGSGTHLQGETRHVLRRRLLAVATIFFAAFVCFMLFGLVLRDLAGNGWVLSLHAFVTLILGLMAVMLYRSKDMSLGRLRLAELVVFGDPALYFAVFSQQRLQHSANLEDGAYLVGIATPWLLLIFTYALFVPNTWRRALAVLGLMGITPLAVIALQWLACSGFQECIAKGGQGIYFSEHLLVMLMAVVTGTVGVQMINELRRQVFAAKQLGQYRLKQKIGSGGMGEVYLAEHEMLKRPCAIKLIRPEKTGDPKVLARFEREVRSTAKLSHWNSIDIFDYGSTADGTFYYVMEYLPGHNVGELVELGGPLGSGRVIYLMQQICSAIAEAHGIGLVHRDIKPANIFCAYRGGEFDVAKLLDFGLAKPMMAIGTDSNLTQEGSITGSPLFMSPEQATGEREADVRSDIYSLGAVMFYLLTGRPPFDYQQPMKVIVAHVSEDPPLPRLFVPSIPQALESIVLRCLEKDPDHRFQDALELRGALTEVGVDPPWDSQRAAEWWTCNGCPQRKALAAAVLEEAAL